MPDLSFKVEKAEARRVRRGFAAAISPCKFPMPSWQIDSCDCPAMRRSASSRDRRNYEPAEQERLTDLFGEPSRQGRTLRPDALGAYQRRRAALQGKRDG